MAGYRTAPLTHRVGSATTSHHFLIHSVAVTIIHSSSSLTQLSFLPTIEQVTSMGDGNDEELFDRCWSMPRTSSPPPSPILVPATLNPPPHLALSSFSKTTSPTKSVDSDNPWTMTPTTSGVVHPSLIIFLPAESMGAVTSSVVHAKLLNNDGGADLPKLLLVRLHEECVQSYLLVFLLPVLASSYMRVEIGRGGTS
jgi:hypothetical protein